MPDISVIVPVYNVKSYLSACLDSILNQDFSSYEVVIIDDGSTDGSGELADQYASRHPDKVRVIHQENQGLGGARNTGIKNAIGEYVAFVDSDDWIKPNMLSILWHEIQQTGADIAVCGLVCITEKGEVVGRVTETQSFHVALSFSEHKDIMLCNPSACNKLYRKSLFIDHDIWFPSHVWYEDIRTIPKLYTVSSSMVFTNQCLYCYLQRSGSIMNNTDVNRNRELLDAFDELRSFYCDRGLWDCFQDELIYLAVSHLYIAASVRIIRSVNGASYILLHEIERYMQLNFPNFLKNPYLNQMDRNKKIVFALLQNRHYRVIRLLFQLRDSINRLVMRAKGWLQLLKRAIPKLIRGMKGYCFHILPMFLFRIAPIDRKKIFITSYYGKGFGDNGKYIAQELHRQKPDIKIYWQTDDRFSLPEYITPVRNRSILGLYHQTTAKIWIDNSRKTSYTLKRKKQYYIQTWHGGIGPKRVEKDAENQLPKDYIDSAKQDSKMTDLMISNSTFCTELYRRAFWYDGEILECGSPRVDFLFNCTELDKKQIKTKLGVSENNRIVLYAPTFRKDKNVDCYSIDFSSVLHLLSQSNDSWKILIRLHPAVANRADFIAYDDNIINATDYPDLYEILAIADVIITDYSSVMFEAAYVGKAVFLFATDILAYRQDRNLYFDLDDLPFPLAQTNDELLDNIRNFSMSSYQQGLETLRSKFGIKEEGHASEAVAQQILRVIGETNEK